MGCRQSPKVIAAYLSKLWAKMATKLVGATIMFALGFWGAWVLQDRLFDRERLEFANQNVESLAAINKQMAARAADIRRRHISLTATVGDYEDAIDRLKRNLDAEKLNVNETICGTDDDAARTNRRALWVLNTAIQASHTDDAGGVPSAASIFSEAREATAEIDWEEAVHGYVDCALQYAELKQRYNQIVRDQQGLNLGP